jgi:hypothetical protein
MARIPYNPIGVNPRALVQDTVVSSQAQQPTQRPARPMRMPMRRPDVIRTTVDFRPTLMRKR